MEKEHLKAARRIAWMFLATLLGIGLMQSGYECSHGLNPACLSCGESAANINRVVPGFFGIIPVHVAGVIGYVIYLYYGVFFRKNSLFTVLLLLGFVFGTVNAAAIAREINSGCNSCSDAWFLNAFISIELFFCFMGNQKVKDVLARASNGR